jgi:Flp pilus assembly protein TadG
MKKKMIIKEQKGVAIVEFAIILPLLLVLMFGIIEFSILLFNKAMLTNASREGARAGIVFAPTRLSEADIKAVVNNYAATHLINFDSSQVLDMDTSPPQHTPSGGTSPGDDTDVDDAISTDIIDSGDSLTVTANYTYQFLLFPNILELIKGSFTNTISITAVSVMRYE